MRTILARAVISMIAHRLKKSGRLFMITLFVVVSVGALSSAQSQQKPATDSFLLQSPHDSDAKVIDRLEADVRSIREGQLNYKVEKDLLKEFYTETISSINRSISIALAIVTLVGFLGLRDIASLRNESQKELAEITGLKAKLAAEIEKISSDHAASMRRYDQLLKAHEENQERLSLLERLRRTDELIQQKNFKHALLQLDALIRKYPEDVSLHSKRATVGGLAGMSDVAVASLETALAHRSDDTDTAVNLAEMLLLNGNLVRAKELRLRSDVRLDLANRPGVNRYYDLLEARIEKDPKKFIAATNDLIDLSVKAPLSWGFKEAIAILRNLASPTRMDKGTLAIVEIVDRHGKVSPEELAKILGVDPKTLMQKEVATTNSAAPMPQPAASVAPSQTTNTESK